MHSSRMRTTRTLTVFQCLVPGRGVYPQRKQKSIKKSPPQKNWGPHIHTQPPLRKIGDPPGTDLQGMLGYPPPGTDLQGMLGYPPTSPVDRQTLVKIVPKKFVSAGKNIPLVSSVEPSTLGLSLVLTSGFMPYHYARSTGETLMMLTALFTKPPDGLLPYRMGSGGRSVWRFPIDIFPFCREWPVTTEPAAL